MKNKNFTNVNLVLGVIFQFLSRPIKYKKPESYKKGSCFDSNMSEILSLNQYKNFQKGLKLSLLFAKSEAKNYHGREISKTVFVAVKGTQEWRFNILN